MLVIALVLALIGLVALVFAVVTSNVLVAWVCIGASVLGVVLLIVDALQERQRRDTVGEAHERQDAAGEEQDSVDYPEQDYSEQDYPEQDYPEVDYPDEMGEDEGARSDTASGEGAADATHESHESAVASEGRGDEPTK